MSARLAVAVLLAVALAGCGADDPGADPCAEPIGEGEVCVVDDACCRARLMASVAAALGEPPLDDLPVNLASSADKCEQATSMAWSEDALEDTLDATARYRFGLHREVHQSQSAAQAAVSCSYFVGRYDSWTDAIELVVPPEGDERDHEKEMIVIAHELVHAYQDQRYDILEWRDYWEDRGAEPEALRSVVEGMAEVVERMVRDALEGVHPEQVDWVAWGEARWSGLLVEVDQAAEPWLTERYSFRYRFGTALAVQPFVGADLSAAAIWTLFDAPPFTTRQVVDVARDGAPLDFAPVTGHSGPALAPEAAALGLWAFDYWWLSGWEAVLWLAPDVGAEAALTATAGWQGGDVRVLLDGDFDPVFLASATFDTEGEAAVFAGILASALAARAGAAGFTDATSVVVEGAQVRLVQAADDALVASLAEAWDAL